MSIRFENVSFAYAENAVLRGVSFSAEDGCFTSLIGPNGAGKSTLFALCAGALRGFGGRILLDGAEAVSLSAQKRACLVAYIPQTAAVPPFTVFESVLLGCAPQLPALAQPSQAQRDAARSAIARVGLAAGADRLLSELSGGERQLAAVARALAQGARNLLFDEPASSLDFGNRTAVLRIMRQLADEGCAVLQSTHDPAQAFFYSDCIAALSHGRLLAAGASAEVLTADLVGELYGTPARTVEAPDGSARFFLPLD